ncbi:bifunctional 4-hydroxy-2-oxoglutarate aldolase/2-dehydro-3-deoxy-phosphogluconate aldolase [Nesterenkonia flava]|uniref:Bifunctional 4-hydroxy-2-oxoglutarate aldolase/2-dehydro-3-deoxy-phosphogluconate aldolase n=1 Tax=Nesterenkonia flava TaxID=469799 RepID=A0ABU1FVF1_9MICC|nr:bifunctional 4-hydroxy-2-oxoglutarate aldolase/2-dehydro-3-deoxy-phosphogluconate aldolase [Nesterenkonia flava]MDR5712656.1 bifunctional 4-hydroxy-2-oxoglutarate aldolase/2-dehydro-3-deoxy-phosphogluconate aldolase [Nesterenkonia flava]
METIRTWYEQVFKKTPVMAILRGYSPEESLELTRRAWDLGIDCVEIPIQDDDGLRALHYVASAAAAEGRSVGAGTVINAVRLDSAVQAGASFTVAPGFDPDVAQASLAAGLPHVPGVATGTDIQACLKLGINVVKAFPASDLGAGWFTAMKGPFPEVSFVATGGMNAHNAAQYLSAGASVIAVGSALKDPEQLPLLAALSRH